MLGKVHNSCSKCYNELSWQVGLSYNLQLFFRWPCEILFQLIQSFSVKRLGFFSRQINIHWKPVLYLSSWTEKAYVYIGEWYVA